MRHASTNRLLALGLTAVLALGTVSCGDDDGDNVTASNGDDVETTVDSGDGSETTAAPTGGTLNVCSDIPYAPMEMEGEGPRGLPYTGFDIELLDAMAETMGSELEILDVDFDGILGNLAAGTCDVVASSVTINEERAQEVDFTEAYFDADQSLLVKADSDVTSLDDLAGKTIGVQTGTTGETYANENTPDGAQVKSFGETDGLFGALESGDIDAILQDLPVNSDRATKDDTVKVVGTIPTGEQYGIVVSKDNAKLTQDINKALAELRSDGTMDSLQQKWFGTTL
jgi:polar amino acid transport system substrate-binding protein